MTSHFEWYPHCQMTRKTRPQRQSPTIEVVAPWQFLFLQESHGAFDPLGRDDDRVNMNDPACHRSQWTTFDRVCPGQLRPAERYGQIKVVCAATRIPSKINSLPCQEES